MSILKGFVRLQPEKSFVLIYFLACLTCLIDYISDPPKCAVIFQHGGYKGKELSIPSGTSWDDLKAHGWNDVASSLKVNPNCVFKGYEHQNMKGRVMSYSSDMSHLRKWNDKISSLSCQCSGRFYIKHSGTYALANVNFKRFCQIAARKIFRFNLLFGLSDMSN